MEYFILYLCSIATDVHNTIIAIGAVIITLCIMMAFGKLCDEEKLPRSIKRYAVTSVILIFMGMLVPKSPQMYAIFGIGKTLIYLKGSDEAKELPDNALRALNHYLEQQVSSKDSIQ